MVDWAKVGRDAGGWIRKVVENEIDEVRTELGNADWKQAGADVVDFGKTLGLIAKELGTKTTQSITEAARESWSEHGRPEATPEATAAASKLEAVLQTPAEAKTILTGMSEADMQAGVAELTEKWTAEGGANVAAQRLEQLESVLGAAVTVATAHDRRARSVPRHQGRPDGVDPTLKSSLTKLQGLVSEAKTQLGGDRTDLRAIAATASQGAWKAGEKIVGQVREWLGGSDQPSAVGETITKARASVAATLDAVSPAWLKDNYEAAKKTMASATQQAETVLTGLDGVQTDAKDADALFARFEAALGTAANAIDNDADAVSIGFLNEAAGGAAGASGKELIYIRRTGELAVVDLEMGGARLAVGASKRPFARSIYGTPDAIKDVKSRSGGEVGALIFHVGTDSSEANDAGDRVKSWHATLGIGFNASLPLVGDQSVYSIRQTELGRHELSVEQQDRIEAMLGGTPETSQKWTSFVRKTLGHGSTAPAD